MKKLHSRRVSWKKLTGPSGTAWSPKDRGKTGLWPETSPQFASARRDRKRRAERVTCSANRKAPAVSGNSIGARRRQPFDPAGTAAPDRTGGNNEPLVLPMRDGHAAGCCLN